MAIVPASTFHEGGLGEGGMLCLFFPTPVLTTATATNVYPFRLKKRKSDDTVTGRLIIKIQVLSGPITTDMPSTPTSPLSPPSPSSPLSRLKPSSPIAIPGRTDG